MQRYRVVIMLVLFGVLPVVAAFFVALSFLEERDEEVAQVEEAPVAEAPPPAPESPRKQAVFATTRALSIGALLGKDDLTTLSLDSSTVDEEHFVVTDAVTDQSLLRGYAVREPLAEGAPLTRSSVVGPGQRGFLAAVLKSGTRAVTIRVGPATSHAGLIAPGDRVDVVLSAELAIDAGDRSVFARTIVEDVRVVAIDRQPGSEADPAAVGADEQDERTEIVTATLEARPAQVDRLVLGEAEGRLSLAVRSLLDTRASDVAAAAGEAVDMREMLLSSSEFSSSEARLRRAQELNDLSVRTQLIESKAQLIESKAQLRAATLETEVRRQAVRIFRGSEPAEEVVFERR